MLLAVFAIVVIRTAWLCDDAYISLRTVDNFTHGYGLRWNVAERVQSFTHPLWVLLLSAVTFISGELFRTTIVVCAILSVATVAWLLFVRASSLWAAIVAGLAVTLSPAFVAYSTSGLEGPLSFALFAAFAWWVLDARRSSAWWFGLGMLAALGCVTRMDHLWIYGAVVGYELWRSRRDPGFASRVRRTALGVLPFVGWLAFALVYYGSLIPNSAVAKLSTGIPRAALVAQGGRYYLDALLREPLTFWITLAGLAWAWVRTRGASRACVVGVVLYLAYVAFVGGDFMRGRFLALPFLVALVLCAGSALPAGAHVGRWRFGIPLVLVVLGFLSPRPPLLSGRDHGRETFSEYRRHAGIADERWMYFREYGLLNEKPTAPKPGADMDALRALRAADSTRLKIAWAVGRSGLLAGPHLHVVDAYGLSDPLLARLPVANVEQWRVGHYARMLPSGYLLSLTVDRNEIRDPTVRELYDAMRTVTRGPLLDGQRWIEILKLNLGRYGALARNHRDYAVVSTDEFVQVYEHLGAGAGPTILWEAALAYIARRELEKAKPVLRSLLEMPQAYRVGYVPPDYALEVTRHALDQDKAGHRAFALELLRFMAELVPDRHELHAAQGAVQLKAGRLTEARKHFEVAEGLGDPRARDVLEQLRRALGDSAWADPQR